MIRELTFGPLVQLWLRSQQAIRNRICLDQVSHVKSRLFVPMPYSLVVDEIVEAIDNLNHIVIDAIRLALIRDPNERATLARLPDMLGACEPYAKL